MNPWIIYSITNQLLSLIHFRKCASQYTQKKKIRGAVKCSIWHWCLLNHIKARRHNLLSISWCFSLTVPLVHLINPHVKYVSTLNAHQNSQRSHHAQTFPVCEITSSFDKLEKRWTPKRKVLNGHGQDLVLFQFDSYCRLIVWKSQTPVLQSMLLLSDLSLLRPDARF